MFRVATFYHFFDFPAYARHRRTLLEEMNRLSLKGSLLLAAEGINGTLAGTRDAIDALMRALEAVAGANIIVKESPCQHLPFKRAKVRLKKEIISLGVSSPADGKGSGRGKYIAPRDWNALIADPQVTLLDARNRYEVHLGTFEGAVDPGIRSFRRLPDFVRKNLDPARHHKIATFCTGGIRCEKFSAWLLEQGFSEVYQLKGGILKYLEDIPKQESRWQGECYVFDERVAVGHGLAPSSDATMCMACGHPLKEEDRHHALYEEGKRCRFCP